MGWRWAARAERTHGNVAAGGPSEVADCGTGQARLQLADPIMWWLADPIMWWLADPGPTFAHR